MSKGKQWALIVVILAALGVGIYAAVNGGKTETVTVTETETVTQIVTDEATKARLAKIEAENAKRLTENERLRDRIAELEQPKITATNQQVTVALSDESEQYDGDHPVQVRMSTEDSHNSVGSTENHQGQAWANLVEANGSVTFNLVLLTSADPVVCEELDDDGERNVFVIIADPYDAADAEENYATKAAIKYLCGSNEFIIDPSWHPSHGSSDKDAAKASVTIKKDTVTVDLPDRTMKGSPSDPATSIHPAGAQTADEALNACVNAGFISSRDAGSVKLLANKEVYGWVGFRDKDDEFEVGRVKKALPAQDLWGCYDSDGEVVGYVQKVCRNEVLPVEAPKASQPSKSTSPATSTNTPATTTPPASTNTPATTTPPAEEPTASTPPTEATQSDSEPARGTTHTDVPDDEPTTDEPADNPADDDPVDSSSDQDSGDSEPANYLGSGSAYVDSVVNGCFGGGVAPAAAVVNHFSVSLEDATTARVNGTLTVDEDAIAALGITAEQISAETKEEADAKAEALAEQLAQAEFAAAQAALKSISCQARDQTLGTTAGKTPTQAGPGAAERMAVDGQAQVTATDANPTRAEAAHSDRDADGSSPVIMADDNPNAVVHSHAEAKDATRQPLTSERTGHVAPSQYEPTTNDDYGFAATDDDINPVSAPGGRGAYPSQD